MKYSAPILKIMERELARIKGRNLDGPTRVVGEINKLHAAVQALEGVALNRNPADNDQLHMKKTHDAGVRLAKVVQATRQRANEILNLHNERLREKLLDQTGLRPPQTLEGIMRQSEFRAAVRSMDANDRRDVLSEAIKARDTDALNALFNASPLVTGMDPNFVKHMKANYQAEVAPAVVAEMQELLEVDSALQAVIRSADGAARESQDERAMRAFVRAQEAAEQANVSFTSAMQVD